MKMTEKACGYSHAEFIRMGWTDETLIKDGYAVADSPPPPKTIGDMLMSGGASGGPMETGKKYFMTPDIDTRIDRALDEVLAEATIDELFEVREIAEHVQCNFEVDDVFSNTEIVEYVSNNVDICDVFKEQDLKDYISGGFTVDEVFSESEIANEVPQAYTVNDIYNDTEILKYVRENILEELVDDVKKLMKEEEDGV